MRKYELVLVLVPDKEDAEKLVIKIKKELEGLGGKIETEEEWGKKTLTYRIKRLTEGFFYFYRVLIEPQVVAAFEQKVRLEEKVLRYLLVREEEVKARGAKKTKEEDPKPEPKKETKTRKRSVKSNKKE
ncbi:MAG: 30S ribosomal protein S6 [bacterium]|nr:30S ribosomal protein S6 [bacterium]